MNGELNEINPLIGVLGEPDDLYGSLDGPLTRGYSAYEIYLEHGGTMTVEEWLASLKGEKGDEPAITTQRTGSKQTTIYADGEQIGIILDGQDGDPGEPGDDGFSPTVETSAITGGHSVTITDASGPHTFNAMDGQDGAPGADGKDGQDGSDGYTPVKGTDYWTSADKAEMEADVAEDLIAPLYTQKTYEVGDLCTQNGALYRCKTAIATAEAWNSSHWQNVRIADVTSSLFGDLSEKIGYDDLAEVLTSVPENVDTDETDSDLDIVDEDGYVLARFVDGHIKTKNFDSSDSSGSEDIYDAAEVRKTNSSADLDIVDSNGNSIMKLGDGNVRTKNFNSRAITPTIITLKSDGTGDFSSLRAAVESITDADYFEKPYEIDVYPGTYNVLSDYTSAEIQTENFYGLMLTDGIDIKGIGNRDEIIIHGELSTDYSSDKRNDISTLNLQDSGRIENITVTAKNIRYCVHDDYPPENTYVYRHTKNCKFRGVALTSGTALKTWGEGSRHGKTSILEDCDFGTTFLWHSDNTGSTTLPQTLIVKNCTALYALIANRNHQVLNNVHLYENNFTLISHEFANVSSTNYMMTVDGTGHDAMTFAPTDWNYMNGDISRFRTDGTQTWSVGKLVAPSTTMHWPSGPLAACTDPVTAYGVVVGADSEWIYVQKRGYIHAQRLGFSNVSVGDKITATAQGDLEINGSGEVFGVVTCVTSDYGSFIRRTV